MTYPPCLKRIPFCQQQETDYRENYHLFKQASDIYR
jgi:hypothetical protein